MKKRLRIEKQINRTWPPNPETDVKLLFIHCPHTAGTSIVRTLQDIPFIEGTIYKGYWGWREAYNNSYLRCRGVKFEDLFIFSFVRNPYDVAVSRYFSTYRKLHWDESRIPTFEKWLIKIWGTKEKRQQKPKIRVKQRIRLVNEKNKVKLNFLGRYETLNYDFQRLCEMINIKPRPLLDIHKTKRKTKPYMEYYTLRALKIVNSYFREDFREFGYQKFRELL